ncbi:hypothetical protein SynPROSU1_02991 [Synechococcus sp. PROS-U-1]|nr:hypothetical protein SynPROSU1_02991 [Synechococcus sp. PROS-U-1]
MKRFIDSLFLWSLNYKILSFLNCCPLLSMEERESGVDTNESLTTIQLCVLM